MLDELVKAFVNQIGGTWILGVMIGLYLIDKFGFVKIIAERLEIGRKNKTEEQSNLRKWQSNFVEELQQEIAAQRQRREEDREEYEERLKTLESRITSLFEDSDKWRRDSSKWRHMAGNMAMYASKLRSDLGRNRIPVPRFDAWDRFIEEGGTEEEFNFDPDGKRQ